MTTHLTEHTTECGRRRATAASPAIVAAVVAVAVAVVAVLAITTPWSTTAAQPTAGAGSAAGGATVTGPQDAALPEVDTAALVDGRPGRGGRQDRPVRLAEGLVPPTNRWFSGLVFGDQPQPVFPRRCRSA